MSLSDILVIAVVVAVAAALAWWFFGPRPAPEAELAGGVQEIRVRVRGGYTPSRIHARPGAPLRLVFDRQESGDCTSRGVPRPGHLRRPVGLHRDHGGPAGAGPRRVRGW